MPSPASHLSRLQVTVLMLAAPLRSPWRKGVEAIAGAGHPGGMADQAGRQVLGGGQIRLAGRLVEEEDPAGVEAEECGDLRKCCAERGVQVDRGVERIGDGVEDGQLALARGRGGRSIALAR